MVIQKQYPVSTRPEPQSDSINPQSRVASRAVRPQLCVGAIVS